MTYDEFIAALENPAVNRDQLKAILMAAEAPEQRRMIEALPRIAMNMVDAQDRVRLIELLSACVGFSKGVHSCYRGNNLAVYWKEHAIAVLLYAGLLDDPLRESISVDHTLLRQSFEDIIEQLLNKYPIHLDQIKNEYGTSILSLIIQRYPNLFGLVLERGAYINGTPPVHYAEGCFPPPLQGLYRSRKPVLLGGFGRGAFNKDLIYVEAERLHPLVACIEALAYDSSNEQLKEILHVLLTHPDLEFDFTLHQYPPLKIARYLGILDVVKEVIQRPVQKIFINTTLRDENHRVSLAPYAYGLSREEVPGDGDCLYHALALHTDTTAADLRLAAADYIEAGHLNDYLAQGHTPQRYAALVRAGGWGDQVEITALMRILGRPIVVLHEDGTPPTMPEHRADFPGAPIFISYNGVDHYTGLRPSRGYVAEDILTQMFPLMQRFRRLPSDLKMYMFSFFSPSERISIVRNTQFDVQCQALEASLLNRSKKRIAPDPETDLDTDDTQDGVDTLTRHKV